MLLNNADSVLISIVYPDPKNWAELATFEQIIKAFEDPDVVRLALTIARLSASFKNARDSHASALLRILRVVFRKRATEALWMSAGSESNEYDRVQAAITLGADVNETLIINVDGDYKLTALMMAATRGHEDVVRLLLRHGADPNAKITDEKTTLMMAAHVGEEKIVEMLLKAGADPDEACVYKRTALLDAANMGFPNVVEVLLDYGADPDKTGQNGWTALMAATGFPNVVKVLLDRGADPDKINKDGMTALSLAVAHGHTDVVQMLEKWRNK